MFRACEELILASGSPRRHSFFRQLGIAFEIALPEIDETPQECELPIHYVERMARTKNEKVAENYAGRWIVSADTIVFLNGVILGKPGSEQEAVDTLMYLSGKIHEVATSFCLASAEREIFHQETVLTKVTFATFCENTARAYVLTGESTDKAGSYGIQGRGGVLVKRLEGSYSNVVGLPLNEVLSALTKYGIVIPK